MLDTPVTGDLFVLANARTRQIHINDLGVKKKRHNFVTMTRESLSHNVSRGFDSPPPPPKFMRAEHYCFAPSTASEAALCLLLLRLHAAARRVHI